MRRVRAIVSGRVQGVSFRAATAEQAKEFGVVGWIQNGSDGCIEIEAEGEPEHSRRAPRLVRSRAHLMRASRGSSSKS